MRLLPTTTHTNQPNTTSKSQHDTTAFFLMLVWNNFSTRTMTRTGRTTTRSLLLHSAAYANNAFEAQYFQDSTTIFVAVSGTLEVTVRAIATFLLGIVSLA
jgi:hypothetical protein